MDELPEGAAAGADGAEVERGASLSLGRVLDGDDDGAGALPSALPSASVLADFLCQAPGEEESADVPRSGEEEGVSRFQLLELLDVNSLMVN
jgi:hypothetical protein